MFGPSLRRADDTELFGVFVDDEKTLGAGAGVGLDWGGTCGLEVAAAAATGFSMSLDVDLGKLVAAAVGAVCCC